jgi:hypothetical protein
MTAGFLKNQSMFQYPRLRRRNMLISSHRVVSRKDAAMKQRRSMVDLTAGNVVTEMPFIAAGLRGTRL